ncbi:MAG TPA: plastocyanin/azurin family copper-binding protein [Nitrososphaerales archaeon]|nr:plastocyanin/azurin family copper-binding protein [Nitrososphaerales archaeon]
MEVEQPKPSTKFLYALGAVMVVVGASLVAEFALRVQPKLVGPPSCTSSGPSSTTCISMPSGAASSQLNFSPSNVTVVIGVNNTILWVNADAVAHTVTSKTIPAGAAAFDSGSINPKSSFTLTLTVPGVYHYYCTIHPIWMEAEIVVLNGTS